MQKVKSLYIHIPFCKKKCPYCDFTAYQGALHMEERYIESLVKELKLYGKNRFKTVYIGGGTPTLLSQDSLAKLFNALELEEDAEVSIEANPTISREMLEHLKNFGVNRISFGAQSFQESLLKVLGRDHTKKDIINAVTLAQSVGIENINLDLIYGAPNQTTQELLEDLEEVKRLNLPHLSFYSLIWEEGTQYYFELEKNRLTELDEDLEASWYFKIDEVLTHAGYQHYEISNFSKLGYESKHNSVYWSNDEYIGIGLGASGYVNNVRYTNLKHFYPYFHKISDGEFPILDSEELDEESVDFNHVMLGLRFLMKGCRVPKRYLSKCEQLLLEGKLEKIGANFRISKKYWYLSNQIIRKILY